MKAVILAGGLGTRLSEETNLKPKPMLEIGGMPIIWHIMRSYSAHGVNEFIICTGYKSAVIKEFFHSYFMYMSDVTFNFGNNSVKYHSPQVEDWKITVVDTGLHTMTGGRLSRIKKYIGSDEDFCVTYGDGLSDVDITEKIYFHRSHKKTSTLTAVLPPGRFGALEMNENSIVAFNEKPRGDGARVNGGFFVFNKDIFNYLQDDETILERYPLETLACENQLMAYKHNGFWHPIDTLRDLKAMQKLWDEGVAPWKRDNVF